ncbi:MAG: hypothetical protein JSS66_18105 [Armatimonadetes bacterium]|nr:hypothetical protein [Armatimonadota bacterium]
MGWTSLLVSERTVASLDRLIKEATNVHAVLFYGTAGSGLEEAASNLARGWLCPNGGCGDCAVCRAYEGGRMVDLMWIKPWGPSGIIKLSAIKRRTPREDDDPEPPLREFFRTRPLMARNKVAVFESAHRMNSDAANALLKTLEEPPEYAKVVLTSSEFARVLPTVRSRCLNIACEAASDPKADEMTRVFAPSPGLAEQVVRHQTAYERLWKLLESSLEAPHGAAIALSEKTREASEALAKSMDTGARAANAEVLRCISEWLMVRHPGKPHLAQEAVELHRFIVQNANPGPVFDLLWAKVLA